MKARFLALLLIAIPALTAPVRAQQPPTNQPGTYDPALFNALRWRSIGPNRGGRSITCAGSTSRPFEYYFGATGGGLWKTGDGGLTWKPVTDAQLEVRPSAQ